MAKIFGVPEGFKAPAISSPFNDKEYLKSCDEYITSLKAWAKAHGTGKYAGEMVSFPVADGKAVYIVLSLKPVTLIHVDAMDAYQFKYANRLTASDIKEEIMKARAIKQLFTKN